MWAHMRAQSSKHPKYTKNLGKNINVNGRTINEEWFKHIVKRKPTSPSSSTRNTLYSAITICLSTWLMLLTLLSLTIAARVLKDRRSRSERGEQEPIKIPNKNLAYILKSTRCPSLLTWPRPYSYNKIVGPQNRLGTTAKTRIGVGKTTCKIDDDNRLEEQFIYLQSFHRTPDARVRKTTTGE
jgi:hypothetical protein